MTLMIAAAVVSSLLRVANPPTGCSGLAGLALDQGITATPVSNPDRPSASFGKSSSAKNTISATLGCCTNTADRHFEIASGWCQSSRIPQPSDDDVELR